MPATLTVPVSDDLLARLQQRAAELGTTPEAFAAECLGQVLPPKPGDLLRRWVGAFDSGLPDAGVRHDEYIGQALHDELRGKSDG